MMVSGANHRGLGPMLRRPFALTVLGAVLLASVAAGEARAATVTPPDVDPTPGDDLLRPVGGPTCTGNFGFGKTFAGLVGLPEGEGWEIDEVTYSIGSDFEDFILDITLDEAGGEVSLEVAAYGCFGVRPTASQPPPTFDVVFTLASDASGEEAICEMVVPSMWVILDERFDFGNTGIGDEGQYDVWVMGASPSVESFVFENTQTPLQQGAIEDDLNASIDNALLASFVEIDCDGGGGTVVPVTPVSALALACEPAVAAVGSLVTCSVTGGDPGIDILWRASAASDVAAGPVTLDAAGRGTFSFTVPASAGDGPIVVDLVDWGRTATVVMSGSLVPSQVPAGGGAPFGRAALTLLALLGAGLVAARPRLPVEG